MPKKIDKIIESIIDNTDKKKVDIISIILMVGISIVTFYLFFCTLSIIHTPVLEKHSWWLYSLLFIFTALIFYLTLLGDRVQKPVNRPKIFLFTAVVMALNTYNILAEVFNYVVTSIIDSIIENVEVPTYLIQTNVKFITVFFPVLIVILVYSKSFQIPFKKEYRDEIFEYSVDWLTRNVDPISKFNVDIKLCEDIETGKDVIITEKIAFRHKLLAGSTGSGKTSLSIRPELAQLFYKKAKFREALKELTYEALTEGLCTLNKPITNKFFNENFSMDYITINEGKRKEFLELFKDYIIGIREGKHSLYNGKQKFQNGIVDIEIPYSKNNEISKIEFVINTYVNNQIYEEIKFDCDQKLISQLQKEKYTVTVELKNYTKMTVDELGEENEEVCTKEINDKVYSQYIRLTIKPTSNEYLDCYSFDINVLQDDESKIIYRDIGIAVIAPDGGLAEEALSIAGKNSIHVHKIDPKMDEIKKGTIAKFNPLMVGSPEKAADIISSILVAMEQTSGKDNNAYFTNASIRAVRNLVVLLRVTYPPRHNGENPILTDVLERLNNFTLVQPEVEFLERDPELSIRWKSVIDYFKTSFYPRPVDGNGKAIPGEYIGSKTKKTEEAISGIINQLDNFIGREELRAIFCDRYDSLNLSDVLEKGECLAISTRQSELGDVLGKAFALMIILSIQNAVLGRYSEDESFEIPFFLTIDEFPFYLNDQTKVFFTFARKYRTSVTCAIQNLAQLEEVSPMFRQIILTNCTTKVILPGVNVEDREYYGKLFGMEEVMDIQTSINSNPAITENAKYSEGERGTLTEKNKISEQQLAELKFKRCYYTTVNPKGNTVVGKGVLDFLKMDGENTVKCKKYNFEKYSKNIFENSIVKENNDNKNNEERKKVINKIKGIVNNSSEDIFDKVSENLFYENYNIDSLENTDDSVEKKINIKKENDCDIIADESSIIEESIPLSEDKEETISDANNTNNACSNNVSNGNDMINEVTYDDFDQFKTQDDIVIDDNIDKNEIHENLEHENFHNTIIEDKKENDNLENSTEEIIIENNSDMKSNNEEIDFNEFDSNDIEIISNQENEEAEKNDEIEKITEDEPEDDFPCFTTTYNPEEYEDIEDEEIQEDDNLTVVRRN